jgi:hypothetical protein
LYRIKNIENSLKRMRFFISFGFIKFNFVVLTKDVDERDALALIEAVSFLSLFFLDLKRYKRIAGNSSSLRLSSGDDFILRNDKIIIL